MGGESVGTVLGIIGTAGVGIGVWVKLRERLVVAETKIATLEDQHKDFKSEFTQLREWLEGQFDAVRRDISRKADRAK